MIQTKIRLAILGYGSRCSEENAKHAQQLGKMAGEQGLSLVAGNTTATFKYAFEAAQAYSVDRICVIEKHKEIKKSALSTQLLTTADTHSKHSKIAQMADAAIVIGGGAGTQLLIKYFLKYKKTIVVIADSGGVSDKELPKGVHLVKNIREAFNLLNGVKEQYHLSTSFGMLSISFDQFALCKAHIAAENKDPNKKDKHPILQQFKEYLAGQRIDFECKVHLQGTEFQKKVWNALLTIPYGKTIGYGELAKQIGEKKANRAVGGAAGKNPIWVMLPCHRVIGKSGKLTGYAGGLEMKMRLLDLEKHQTELELF